MLARVSTLPTYVEIETSRRCNRQCNWCPNGHHDHRRTQELMEWKVPGGLGALGYGGWFVGLWSGCPDGPVPPRSRGGGLVGKSGLPVLFAGAARDQTRRPWLRGGRAPRGRSRAFQGG